jgi:acyl-CoA thioesterase
MKYNDALNSLESVEGGWIATIGADWQQGRTLFGGLQAALAVRAMRQLPETVGLPLRVLQTTFIAPVPAGDIHIEARVLRTGKSTAHVEARLRVDGAIGCALIAVFGAARESRIVLAPPPPALDPARPHGTEMPYIEGMTPAFTQHLRFQWADGGFPFSGADEARTRIFVSLREATAIGESEVIAFADAIPTPALSMLKKPTAASSLTWTLELLTDTFDTASEKPWLMDAEVSAGRDGYLSQSAVLWDPAAQAVAMSRQSVVIFG